MRALTARQLTDTINLIKVPNLFLWKMLIGEEKAYPTAEVEIHTKVGDRTIVPLVARKANGTILLDSAHERTIITPDLLKPSVIADIDQMLTVGFGQTIYDDPAAAYKELIKEKMKTLKITTARTKQYLLAELLTSGAYPVADGKEGIVYGDLNKTVLSGSSLWSDDNSDPIADLKRIRKKMQEEGVGVPNTLIVSPEIATVLQNHPKILEKLKLTEANILKVKPQELAEGVVYIGYIAEVGTDVYSYTEFVDVEGESKELLPENIALYCTKGSFKCSYAAITAREKHGATPKLYVKKEVMIKREVGDDDEYQLLSAPVVIPKKGAKSWAIIEAI